MRGAKLGLQGALSGIIRVNVPLTHEQALEPQRETDRALIAQMAALYSFANDINGLPGKIKRIEHTVLRILEQTRVWDVQPSLTTSNCSSFQGRRHGCSRGSQLVDNGWMSDAVGSILFYVPLTYRDPLWWPDTAAIISAPQSPRLDSMLHADLAQRIRCYLRLHHKGTVAGPRRSRQLSSILAGSTSHISSTTTRTSTFLQQPCLKQFVRGEDWTSYYWRGHTICWDIISNCTFPAPPHIYFPPCL